MLPVYKMLRLFWDHFRREHDVFFFLLSMGSGGFEQQITETHECCHGYRRVEGQSGCPEGKQYVLM